MKEYIFDKVNESIFKETLDNGIDVYLYPNLKTKNFYCTITVNYGSSYTKYKKNNIEYDIIPGSAHFLEHRIMLIGEDPKLSERINDLGSLANAWTNYKGTNYNIFGSENILENIHILLDLFNNAKFEKKDVEEEKGIISEEIDMNKDKIDRYLSNELYKNLFHNSYPKNTVIGEKEDINKITSKSLKQIYDHFYIPNNTFIVITGNFNKEEVMDYIKTYYKKLKLKQQELPIKSKIKEPEMVKVQYEEIKKDMEDVRVKYAIKMKKNRFNMKDDSMLRCYLNMITRLAFSTSSKLFEKYKNEGLIFTIGAYASIMDDYVVIEISSITNKPEELLNNLKIDIENLNIDKEEFERVKKKFIKMYIMGFENIEDVEANITMSLITDGKIDYHEYSVINDLSYDKAIEILRSIDITHTSIIKTVK